MSKEPCLILVATLVARAAVLGASVGDAIAVTALAALYGWHLYLASTKEQPVNESIKEEISALKTAVSSIRVALTQRR